MALLVYLFVKILLFASPSPHPEHLLLGRFLVIPHAVTGLATFLIGPFQFSTRLRQRNLGLHRVLGKVYVFSVFFSVFAALLLGRALPYFLRIASASQGALWFLCTAAAFATARNRHIAQHRIWMIRSYSITLSFFTVRVLIPIPAYGRMDSVGIATSVFIAQIAALVVPEIAFHWNALTTRRK